MPATHPQRLGGTERAAEHGVIMRRRGRRDGFLRPLRRRRRRRPACRSTRLWPRRRLTVAIAAILDPRHRRVAGNILPVEIQIRMRVLERFHHFRIQRGAAETRIRGRSKQVQQTRPSGIVAGRMIGMHHVRVFESPLVAGLPDKRHSRLPLARALGSRLRLGGRLLRLGGRLRLLRRGSCCLVVFRWLRRHRRLRRLRGRFFLGSRRRRL
jgi:hypothetical protein